jgi:teichoic acid transport system permease protein
VTDVQQAVGSVLPTTDDARALAEQYGMTRAGARPPLGRYLRDIWGRRHFIVAYTKASNAVAYNRNLLGQVWQILTPLLNAAVYYLVFGVLLHTKSSIHNYSAYLIIGILIFTYMQSAIINGSRAVTNNLNIIRALHFPRASLPLGTTAIAFQQLLMSLLVIIPIVLLTREPFRLQWLMLIPALLLESMFALGVALVAARIGSHIPDTAHLLPFLLRTWLYLSGIFYSVTLITRGHSHWIRNVLQFNPGAIYPHLVRDALLTNQPHVNYAWEAATIWAVAAFVFGLFFFWLAEESYGRG